MHAADVDATLARERALLLEALTLLVQRQAETESALADQVARTSTRVANLERRGVELDARVADIDVRLRQLATQVEPDPGLPRRVAVLQAQLEQLHTARVAEEPPSQSSAPQPQPPQTIQQPPPPSTSQAQTARAHEPSVHAARVRSADNLLDRLGNTTQDRASTVLIATGVLVVVFAAVAQLRVG